MCSCFIESIRSKSLKIIVVCIFLFILAEPYNYFGRRGRKEPEALAAASLKRLFVENQPYLVGGYSQHESSGCTIASNGIIKSVFSSSLQRLKASRLSAPNNILSMAEKYQHMRQTFHKRLAFGKLVFQISI